MGTSTVPSVESWRSWCYVGREPRLLRPGLRYHENEKVRLLLSSLGLCSAMLRSLVLRVSCTQDCTLMYGHAGPRVCLSLCIVGRLGCVSLGGCPLSLPSPLPGLHHALPAECC